MCTTAVDGHWMTFINSNYFGDCLVRKHTSRHGVTFLRRNAAARENCLPPPKFAHVKIAFFFLWGNCAHCVFFCHQRERGGTCGHYGMAHHQRSLQHYLHTTLLRGAICASGISFYSWLRSQCFSFLAHTRPLLFCSSNASAAAAKVVEIFNISSLALLFRDLHVAPAPDKKTPHASRIMH